VAAWSAISHTEIPIVKGVKAWRNKVSIFWTIS
jgi:hypothetical protein